jgi:hypothetical protein
MNLHETNQFILGSPHVEYTSLVNNSLHFFTELIRKLEELKDANLISFVTSVDELIQITNKFKTS